MTDFLDFFPNKQSLFSKKRKKKRNPLVITCFNLLIWELKMEKFIK